MSLLMCLLCLSARTFFGNSATALSFNLSPSPSWPSGSQQTTALGTTSTSPMAPPISRTDGYPTIGPRSPAACSSSATRPECVASRTPHPDPCHLPAYGQPSREAVVRARARRTLLVPASASCPFVVHLPCRLSLPSSLTCGRRASCSCQAHLSAAAQRREKVRRSRPLTVLPWSWSRHLGRARRVGRRTRPPSRRVTF